MIDHWSAVRVAWYMFTQTLREIYGAHKRIGLRPGDRIVFTVTVNIYGGPEGDGGIRFEVAWDTA
jgi:hypothetical protein